MILPPEAQPLVQVLAVHFTNPTYQRFSAVLTTRRRATAKLSLDECRAFIESVIKAKD